MELIPIVKGFHKDESDIVTQLWMNAITKVHPFIPRGHWLNQYRIVRNKHFSMTETFVHGEHGRLKGFVSILEGSFIAALLVDVNNQNHGISTELIRWCQGRYSHLEANVYKKNENTVYFYTKRGFVIECELTNLGICKQELFMAWKKD